MAKIMQISDKDKFKNRFIFSKQNFHMILRATILYNNRAASQMRSNCTVLIVGK